MPIKSFPDVKYADPETGLIAVGGDISVESLLLAYKNGIFPWPVSDEYLTWFTPPDRAILYTDKMHVSKSLKRYYNQNKFAYKINTNFLKVIESCALVSVRKEDSDTWITDEIIDAYYEFFKAGHAYSVESYLDKKLVGGFYGVIVNGFISAESMFHFESNASKLALYFFVELLKKKNVGWIDFQVLNPFTESLGAEEIEREKFIDLLSKELKKSQLIIK
ncbi:UNVERIFIED_CONTAM: hypothetical protein GTU68_054501 [Idotea baltica]|nr:hypothetical protein [Idotea baltica]